MIFTAFFIISATSVIALYSTQRSESLLRQGDVVELKNVPFFWHDKVSVTEKQPDNEDKVDIKIYFVINCGSKVKENTTSSTSRYLVFTHPDKLDDDLYGVYLLKGSYLNFTTILDPSSDLSHPVKLCQFSSEKSATALTEATDIAAIEEAEEKGQCHDINNMGKKVIKHSISTHGYYYYVLSAYSTTNGVNLSYSYELIIKYYDRHDFTPEDCSVIDDDCTKTGLTKANLDTLCVLAYAPLLKTDDRKEYTFTVMLSSPVGIIIVVAAIAFLIIIVIVLTCAFQKWRHV